MYLLFGVTVLPWGLLSDRLGDTTGQLVVAFAILCVAMMLGGVAYRCVTVVLPSYFELRNPALLAYLGNLDWLPTSRNVAATALSSLVFSVGMLGQYLGGRVAERFEPRRGYLPGPFCSNLGL